MQSPETRKRFPGSEGYFNFFDKMLKENGPGCPRLSAIWDTVFPRHNLEAQEWIKKFAGIHTTPVAVPQGKPVPSIVKRAITVLNSYQKT
jgi:hypothetical protein